MDSTKKKKNIAAHDEKLPWELMEEILYRVPPKTLVHFRTVSKQLSSKTSCSSTTTSQQSKIPNYLVDCDEFLLLCDMDIGTAVWNPWLNQTKLIKPELGFQIDGIGYVNNKNSNTTRIEEKVYKALASYSKGSYPNVETCWKIYDFAPDARENKGHCVDDTTEGEKEPTSHNLGGVPLNGTLYWVAFYDETDSLYHLTKFDFSSEKFLKFCDLPCGINHRRRDALVLRVFKGDRFSLLKQCHVTKKVEIWVTKNKINVEDGDGVVWMNFMTFSIPNFPGLVQYYSKPSYFIDDKKLVVCSCDETGQAWIYVVEGNKLINKVQVDSAVDRWPSHCTYFPSLVPVPRGQREV
ncbi:unnamed protein product [Microthlaspi erraticum]|uniref:F-box associated beta-propeller type 1 domain-containing protein n=1 Tax=Microthlaspi erraticum TaxID=1685480 RepID=A0A6D2KBG2_9BRAS|nr:unnamed protein product [Microthlaspi erraticum]